MAAITRKLVDELPASWCREEKRSTSLFRSRLRRLTMSEAVRSNSLALEPLGSWYTDQTTWRDLASTRNTVPLPRPNEEFAPGVASLFTVRRAGDCWERPCPCLCPLLALLFRGLGPAFSGAGGGKISSSFACRAFSDAVREDGVGQLGVRHHLEQVVVGQPVRQVLVETVGHRQHVHRMHARKFRAAQPARRNRTGGAEAASLLP